MLTYVFIAADFWSKYFCDYHMFFIYSFFSIRRSMYLTNLNTEQKE